MKLLIVADVHGNLDALQAMEREEGSWDHLICLGDTVDYGPAPAECISWMHDRAGLAVKGDHDAAVAERYHCATYRGLSPEVREWTRSCLGESELSWLRMLPLTEEVSFGAHRTYMAHAAPTDPLLRFLTPDTPWEEMRAEIARVEADLILLGHSHLPMVRTYGYKAVVNPGSLGQPRDGDRRASYAVWRDGRVEIKRVGYDIESAIRRYEGSWLRPELVQELARILRNGQ